MKVVQEGSLKNPSFHGIIIKDPHCNWGFANRIRHNHEDDLDFKWGFLQDYMNQNNIQDLIITGDLVDSNDEKKWSFKQYYKNKEKLLKFKQSKTFWSIAGNHDMLNGFEGVNETPFGEFVRENVIEHLTNKPICLGENSWIYGKSKCF
jgi:predicted MPP superfamily phosphohydrolase